ncbi:hypothetical protein LCGC14_2343260, partial [marine sediment metagenome]
MNYSPISFGEFPLQGAKFADEYGTIHSCSLQFISYDDTADLVALRLVEWVYDDDDVR